MIRKIFKFKRTFIYSLVQITWNRKQHANQKKKKNQHKQNLLASILENGKQSYQKKDTKKKQYEECWPKKLSTIVNDDDHTHTHTNEKKRWKIFHYLKMLIQSNS